MSYRSAVLWGLKVSSLLPIMFMLPGLAILSSVTYKMGNDVLGTGAVLTFIAMLAVTPLRTLTKQQWFVPMRRWFGIVFALDAFLGTAIATRDPRFHNPYNALTIHDYLLTGTAMTLILIPLFIQGVRNKWSMKQLGKFWKPFQQYGVYTIWAILGIHLAMLEGFGAGHPGDRFPFNILHQRLYQFIAASAVLIVLRIPSVRKWCGGMRSDRRAREMWLVLAPLILIFALSYGFCMNELLLKGIAALSLHPIPN